MALIESEIRKREKFVSSKKISADGLQHDLEGKPDVDRVAHTSALLIFLSPCTFSVSGKFLEIPSLTKRCSKWSPNLVQALVGSGEA